MPHLKYWNLSSLESLLLCISAGGALAKFRNACLSSTTRYVPSAEVEVANQPLNSTLVYIAANAADTVQVLSDLLRMEVQCLF